MTRHLHIQKLRAAVGHEKKVARDIGGRRTAASGALPGHKGDAYNERWLVEAKQTKSPRYALTLEVWRKIELEAFDKKRLPVLVIDMAGRRVAVVDYNDWLALAPHA